MEKQVALLAAIIIDESFGVPGDSQGPVRLGARPMPWAHLDVLGRPAIQRFSDSLKQQGCESILIAGDHSQYADGQYVSHGSTIDFLAERVGRLKQDGHETILIARFAAYTEFSLEQMLEVHKEEGKGITRLAAEQDSLDVWIVDISRLCNDKPILSTLQVAIPAIYRSQSYVNPLRSARDYRRLVVDSFNSRCRCRPIGTETRPGVWVNEGAEIDRTARLVAPAFIGTGVRISEECLITRCSNIESASFVDFGTAVEDSSILPNTYVGIGLDLAHSIVDGRNLFNLRHNVVLDITDPVVMRRNTKGEVNQSWPRVEGRALALTAE